MKKKGVMKKPMCIASFEYLNWFDLQTKLMTDIHKNTHKNRN